MLLDIFSYTLYEHTLIVMNILICIRGLKIMKYFILITFFILSSLSYDLSYADDYTILCDASFLESTTSEDLANTLRNIRVNIRDGERQSRSRLQEIVQEIVFSNRTALMMHALRQVCDETTGDNPMHLAARVATDFGVVTLLIQEERGHISYPKNYSEDVILRKNKLDETPFDILRSRFAKDLSEQAVNNLNALLEIYFMQETVARTPLRRRR